MIEAVLDVIFVLCLAAVAVGAGLVFFPAGLIAGGLEGAAAILFYARGGDTE